MKELVNCCGPIGFLMAIAMMFCFLIIVISIIGIIYLVLNYIGVARKSSIGIVIKKTSDLHGGPYPGVIRLKVCDKECSFDQPSVELFGSLSAGDHVFVKYLTGRFSKLIWVKSVTRKITASKESR